LPRLLIKGIEEFKVQEYRTRRPPNLFGLDLKEREKQDICFLIWIIKE
jgi:hypothetical protein